jgi:diguanylate cyclase (GGDEF)-like protein
MIYQVIRKIGAIGNLPDYSSSFRRSVSITNYFALLGIVSEIFFNFLYMASGFPDFIATAVSIGIFLPVFLFAIYLNYKHYHYPASLLLNLSAPSSILVVSTVLGNQLPGIHYYFLFFTIMPIVTFPLRKVTTILIIFFVNFSSFLFSEYTLFIHPPVYDFSYFTAGIFFGITVFLVTLSIAVIFFLNQYFFNKAEVNLQIEIENNKKMIDQLESANRAQKDLAAELSERTSELLQKNDTLKNLAIRDGLTGLYNKYYFDEVLYDSSNRTSRYGEPLTLVLIDVDHFKTINDTHGHDTGDLVLVELAEILKRTVRKADILCRWGGEEFAVLMPQTTKDGGVTASEKMRKSIEDTKFHVIGNLTASFGVAQRAEKENNEDWFKRVDKALYAAKEQGRNQVVSS